MSRLPYRRTLDQFTVGETLDHWPHKTVTESDNNLFCLLTLNHHPVHSDAVYAGGTQHGKLLVVGTYVLSTVVGMTVPEISGAAIANLEYEKVVHNGPVFIGDTIRAETEVLDVIPSKTKSDRGVLYVETRAFNQREEKILTFRRRILLPLSK
ncbi:MAG: dehydratase [Desulfuromonas sp.]|uniref:MaoC family dehydratase n=1 Tax=Desulfuromonas sp. TaxID=892 RepID=UPI000CCB1618|nr:MaoC family dehydratase [Desulfuromonas sp.]PLX84412.1 MAG: dehydratase [Desulfuromonas sp.]